MGAFGLSWMLFLYCGLYHMEYYKSINGTEMACVQPIRQFNRDILIHIHDTQVDRRIDRHVFKRLRDLEICSVKQTSRGGGRTGETKVTRPNNTVRPI